MNSVIWFRITNLITYVTSFFSISYYSNVRLISKMLFKILLTLDSAFIRKKYNIGNCKYPDWSPWTLSTSKMVGRHRRARGPARLVPIHLFNSNLDFVRGPLHSNSIGCVSVRKVPALYPYLCDVINERTLTYLVLGLS